MSGTFEAPPGANGTVLNDGPPFVAKIKALVYIPEPYGLNDPHTLDAEIVLAGSGAQEQWQWSRYNPGNGVWKPIPGATNSQYTPQAADHNKLVRAEATVTEPDGSVLTLDTQSVKVLGSGVSEQLSGSRNIVLGRVGAHTIWGGGNYNDIVLGKGHNKVWVPHSHSTIEIGDGRDKLVVDGSSNHMTLGTGHKTITEGPTAASNTFVLDGSNANLLLEGTGNTVFATGGTDKITDTAAGNDNLQVGIGSAGTTVSIANFSVTSGIVFVPLWICDNHGWSNPSQIAAALVSDHHHGSMLLFGRSGSVDFLGIPHNSGELTGINFRLG